MKTVLIVEDEKIIRQGIKAMISRGSVPVEEIIECKNGEEALKVLRERSVDVMITDIRMPKMDGITLVKEMKELSSTPPQTIAISGYDDFSYAVELLRQGVREYILKPIEREKLNAILEKLEEELKQKKENEEIKEKIGFQQIKYLLLNDNIEEGELEVIEKQYSGCIYNESYYAACTNYLQAGFSMEGAVHLKDIDRQDIYFVGKSHLEEFKQKMADTYIGFSREYSSIRELKQAYKEALKARKQAFVLCEKQVFFEEKNLDYGQIPQEDIERIVQMISASDMEEINKLMEHMIFQAKRRMISPREFEQAIVNLIDLLYKNYKNVVEIDMIKGNQCKCIYNYSTIDDFYKDFYDWLSCFRRGMASELEDYKNKQKIQTAIEYVKENYRKDLNMAVVSNHVSMNYSLFSYAFKQYTGSNFVYYLKKIRIDEAKRLLAETDRKVSDIAQMVGYDNEKYFMKTFKSVSGVSATEYRRNAAIGRS